MVFLKKLLSGRGSNFLSKVANMVYKLLNITKLNTTPCHLETDGLVERFNRTLINMISKYVDENQKDWDNWLPYILYAYRTSTRDSTKFTPFVLMFGREPVLPIEISLSPVEEKIWSEEQYLQELTKGLFFIHIRQRLVWILYKTSLTSFVEENNFSHSTKRCRELFELKEKIKFIEIGSYYRSMVETQ